MVDHNKLSVTELLEMDNKSLVSIIVSLQGQISEISGQLGLLIEQLAVANQRTFGRKSEKASDNDQLSFFDLGLNLFNEAEANSDDPNEPAITEVTVSGHTRKIKTSWKQTRLQTGLFFPANITFLLFMRLCIKTCIAVMSFMLMKHLVALSVTDVIPTLRVICGSITPVHTSQNILL